MSFEEWSNNKKKKKNTHSSFDEWSNAKHGISEEEKDSALEWRDDEKKKENERTLRELFNREEDIAPVKGGNKNSVFKSGGFSDGVDGVGDFFVDLGQTVGGTVGDLGMSFVKGAGRLVEGVFDLGSYGVAGVADLVGADDFAEKTRKAAQRSTTDRLTKGATDYLDQYSVLGNKADAVGEGLGQVGAIILTGGLGATPAAASAITTGVTFASGMGSGMGDAYAMGASDGSAVAYGATVGSLEAVSEMIFGGLGKGFKALGVSKGLTSIDDVFAKKMSNAAAKFITSEAGQKVVGNTLEYAVKSGAEGLEEVISGFGSAIAKDAYLMNGEDEKAFGEILKDENLLEQFVVGSIVSGIAQGGDFISSTKNGRDFVSGLSKNEQTVVDKVYEQRLAEESENRTLSNRDKNKLYERVVEEMKRGYVTTDEIESILGGETYKGYKGLADKKKSLEERKKAIEEEIKSLVKTPESQFTIEQREKLTSLREEAKGIKEALQNLGIKTAKNNLFNEVNKLTAKDTFLRESYNDLERQKQALQIDENQYNGTKFADAAKKTIENARKAKASNSIRVRDFVEFSAKYSSVSGTVVDFKDANQINKILEDQLNAKITTLQKSTTAEDKAKLAKVQEMLKDVQDGKIHVNGVKTKDGVAINLKSPNYLNVVLGHEVTHFLEGKNAYEPLQKAIFKYAQHKGDLDGRRSVLEALYENIDGTSVDYELTADLVGDYLFTEYDFIKNLSTEDRNVFQKVYDQIKYMFKLATAGSKEARELEKVMHQFERALRESAETSQNAEHDEVTTNNAKYSISVDSKGNELSPAVQKRFEKSKAVDENGDLKVLYHGTASGEFFTFDKSKGSVEGDFGSGFYFTDNEYDVERNYEDGGPDFDNKVARRAEQIEAEEDIEYSEAEARAREELYVGGNKFEVYLNIENPCIVGETNLFDYDRYASEYDPEAYDSEEDYEGDVEQLIADDIDQIIWDIERNVDVYNMDGVAEVLWNAVNEGGIDAEQLKANINNLYLEDSNGNMVGNEVTRQIIESLGYDGIIDNTVSHKFSNMGLSEDTTHYIVFKPNQIKDISNQNPTDNPDIRYSLSKSPLDNSTDLGYNVNDDLKRGDGYVRTVEFRKLQAESQRMSDEDIQLYHSGNRKIDEGLRANLARVLRGQIHAYRNGLRNDDGILSLSNEGNEFNMCKSVNGSLFHDCFEISQKYLRNGELVDLHGVKTTEDGIGYDDCDNYLSEDGLSGFSITPDGDLISVFNASGKGGFLSAIAPVVRENAKTLDCYNSPNQPLCKMYEKKFGFKTASVMDYNMEYDHDNIAANHNKPKVAFMVNTASDVETKYFSEIEYDEAKTYRDSFVNQTTDSDIAPVGNFSLSNESEKRTLGGSYRFDGKDFRTPANETALEQDIAPIAEGVVEDTAFDAPMLEDIPILPDEELEQGTIAAIRPKPEKQPSMKRVNNAESKEHIAQVLTEEPKVEKKKKGILSSLVRNFVDKGAVFENLSLKTKNRALQDTYKAMGRSETKAQYFMENGKEGVKPLNDIIAEVEQTGKTKEFYEYLYHKHNVDRMSLESRERPNLERLTRKMNDLKLLKLQENQLRAIASEKITNETAPKRVDLIKTVREYLKSKDVTNKPVFDYSVTAEMSQATANQLETKNPEFKGYAKDVYDYMNHLRQMMIDKGVISQETADLWAETYPYYVPIRRAGHDGLAVNVPLDTNKTGINAPIKRATGGNSDILPLFETMAQRTLQTFKAIDKNRFGVELKNTLGNTVERTTTNIDEVIDSIDAHESLLQEGKNGRNPTFTVFENGERVTFDITDEMYDALKPTSEGLSYTNKVLNTASNLHRGVLTEYSVPFMVTNAIKDAQDVLINSQHPAQTYANSPVAIKELITKGKWYTEYMENGGGDNTYFDKQTNTFNKEQSALRKIVGFPIDKISDANNFIEKVPRLAEYIASRKNGASIDAAMLDAARVTTDFSAGGDVTKFLNRNGATFLNASVQGFAQQVRNVREAKMNGLKGWLGLATKTIMAGLPAMLLNGLLWDDDEEYEELSDYVKENYYIVGKYGDGKFVRIPKGRTVAVIQNGFEQISNALTGDDEVDFGRFAELALSNLAPNNPIDNNIIAPIKQVMENKTWYGEDLVPTRLQDLPAAEQFDESTDAVSKWLGENLNVSPYKINYLLNQYSGGIGDIFLPMMTPEAESGDNSLLGNLIAPLKDKFTTDSVMNNQNVSDFYSKADELKVKANSSYATEEDILKNKYMNAVNSELGELYKAKREIQNSSLSDEAKYAQVREIQKQINALAKESLNTYDNVVSEDNYANVGDKHYKQNDEGEWQKINDKQVEKQAPFVKVYGGYSSYLKYSSDLYDIKADKDEYGKSISGSRKEKVLNYINNLDADYETKIILWKSEYPSDDTYNMDIINYLNNRADLTYEERVAILTELGFTVSGDTVYWD